MALLARRERLALCFGTRWRCAIKAFADPSDTRKAVSAPLSADAVIDDGRPGTTSPIVLTTIIDNSIDPAGP
jgi:hypothetical protein